MTDKDKQVFKDILKGNWVPEDVFGTPMVVGELLLYATGGGGGAICWRVGKIIEVVVKKRDWGNGIMHKLKLRSAQKWGTEWQMVDRYTYLTNVNNAFVLTDPSEIIVELFKDAND